MGSLQEITCTHLEGSINKHSRLWLVSFFWYHLICLSLWSKKALCWHETKVMAPSPLPGLVTSSKAYVNYYLCSCMHAHIISIGEGRAKRQARKEEWASHCRQPEPFSFPLLFHIILLFVYFIFLIFIFFSHTIHFNHSFPSLHPSQQPLLTPAPPPKKSRFFRDVHLTQHSRIQ